MSEDQYPEERLPGRYVTVSEIVHHAALAIDAMCRLYETLDVNDEAVTFQVDLLGTEHRALRAWAASQQQRYASYQARIPEIRQRRTLPLSGWRTKKADLSRELAIEILRLFNWEGADFPRPKIEEFFKNPRPARRY